MKIHHHLLASLLLAAASNAHAVYTINILEAGGNVVINGSGSINTTGMISNGSVQPCANGRVGPISLCLGTSPIGLQFVGVVSPALTALTTGAFTSGNASSGQPVYIANSDLFLPAGYVSASPLAGSATFNGQTFAGLGLTAGSRTLTLTSGDSIVINVGAVAPAATTTAAIPTLGEYGVMALASLMAMAGMVVMRRRKG